MRRFVQIRVRVPTAVQDQLTAWWMARGALGIQEDHPGLRPIDGPVVSGDPAEWAGSALPNPSSEVALTAWFEEPATPEQEALAVQAFLATSPGCAPDLEKPVADWLEERDWNAEWKASWEPVVIGRVRIVPSWLPSPEPSGDGVVLRLDPGMAFGTGTPPTTATCLEFLQQVLRKQDPRTMDVPDVGTGSGILARAALALGARSAMGDRPGPRRATGGQGERATQYAGGALAPVLQDADRG